MHHTAPILLASLACAGVCAAQSDAASAAQRSPIKALVERIERREKALGALRIEMRTTGSYPGGTTFETRGWLRVLEKTHSQFEVEAVFRPHGDEEAQVTSLHAAVITPEGVWSHQRGAAEESYTFMDPELVRQLQTASVALTAYHKKTNDSLLGLPGPLWRQNRAVLGSDQLRALDHQFDLRPQEGIHQVGPWECSLLAGVWRGFEGIPADEMPTETTHPDRAVHRVEVYLRRADGIPVRIVQYNKTRADDGGKTFSESVALEIRLTAIELDPKLQPTDFRLDLPETVVFQDARNHPASRAQIERLLDEYGALPAEFRKGN